MHDPVALFESGKCSEHIGISSGSLNAPSLAYLTARLEQRPGLDDLDTSLDFLPSMPPPSDKSPELLFRRH